MMPISSHSALRHGIHFAAALIALAGWALIASTASVEAQSLHRQVELYRWADFGIQAPGAASGAARFDVEGSCTWIHQESGAKRTSLVWYSGSGDTYVYRFGASFQGRWTCTTSSPVAALNGIQLTVDVTPSSNPNRSGWSGQLPNEKTAWARQQGPDGQLQKRTPILIMMPQVQRWYSNLGSMRDFVAEFGDAHGFTGGHILAVGRAWFEAGSTGSLSSAPPAPDPRTFAALEAAAAEWSERGGWLHIWMWGKGSSHDFKNLPGGYNGAQSRRINRYIAARLGPVPGWSMGIGWDVEWWISETRLKWWLDDLGGRIKTGGWHHWIGHRYSDSDIGQGVDPEPANKGQYLSRGIRWNTLLPGDQQYAGWEHWRTQTSNSEIDAGLKAVPDRPMFSEDRFRRRDGVWTQKDLLKDDEILTEIPRWASRGVAAIYGRLLKNSSDQGSEVWPNKAEIKAVIAQIDESPSTGTGQQQEQEQQQQQQTPQPVGAAPCHLLGAADPVPAGFGAAYDALAPARELLLRATCDGAGATVTVGAGLPTQYVHRRGYEWRDNQWRPFELEGDERAGDWYVGSAQATLPRTPAELQSPNHVVAYVCTWTGAEWKCGCRDQACAASHWQLQGFRRPLPPSPPGLPSAPGGG